MITAEEVRELFNYDPISGELTRRVRRSNYKAQAGAVPGMVSEYGYRRIHIGKKLYLAHRLIWLHVHGEWPPHDVDHINGNRLDNRISNLRLATRAENRQNVGIRSNNKSGYIGVSWASRAQKYRAQIAVGGKTRHLGSFDTAEQAHAAYVAAKKHLHPFQPQYVSRR